jgi:hypothetical protein
MPRDGTIVDLTPLPFVPFEFKRYRIDPDDQKRASINLPTSSRPQRPVDHTAIKM